MNSKNQNFLSKIYKFELLSLKKEEKQQQKDKQKLIRTLAQLRDDILKMPIISTTTNRLNNSVRKATRSKSIGCEEDLKKLIKNKKLYFKQIKQYINELRLKKNELNNSSNCVNELLKSPLFLHIHKNLIHFIDDDDDDNDDYLLKNQQQNEKIKQNQFNLLNLNQHKDVRNNEDDDNNEDSEDNDDTKLVTKSVPNSPRLFLRSDDNTNNRNQEISFVYDVNLYTERNNLDLIAFDQEKENLESKKNMVIDYDNNNDNELKMNKASSNSSSRSSSLSSLHKFVNKQLEPLEINEDKKMQKGNNINNAPLTSSPSNTLSSSTSIEVDSSSNDGAQINDSSTTSLTPIKIDDIDTKETNSNDSLKDVDLIEDEIKDDFNYKTQEQELKTKSKDEDFDNESINSLSESQIYLKENYEKAKKERQLEEETAIQEKKRLQVNMIFFFFVVSYLY